MTTTTADKFKCPRCGSGRTKPLSIAIASGTRRRNTVGMSRRSIWGSTSTYKSDLVSSLPQRPTNAGAYLCMFLTVNERSDASPARKDYVLLVWKSMKPVSPKRSGDSQPARLRSSSPRFVLALLPFTVQALTPEVYIESEPGKIVVVLGSEQGF